MSEIDLMRHWAALKAEESPEDPWQELLKLADVDPAVSRVVDMVRYHGMAVGDACAFLALYQTRRAMMLQEKMINLYDRMPISIVLSKDDAPLKRSN